MKAFQKASKKGRIAFVTMVSVFSVALFLLLATAAYIGANSDTGPSVLLGDQAWVTVAIIGAAVATGVCAAMLSFMDGQIIKGGLLPKGVHAAAVPMDCPSYFVRNENMCNNPNKLATMQGGTAVVLSDTPVSSFGTSAMQKSYPYALAAP
jgi:hypothetical protein